jgi:hypothetical protein
VLRALCFSHHLPFAKIKPLCAPTSIIPTSRQAGAALPAKEKSLTYLQISPRDGGAVY